ncbi:MAG: type II secretion system protein [Actinomycetota bacterium]|nr:type II secretion system protein [Actinomycetota bacterium]
MDREKGFTLIELMIVILIVGILVGIAVPVFVSARENSEGKVCKSNLRAIKTASIVYNASSGTYPASVSDLVPDYMKDDPICPAVGDGSAYVLESGGGPDLPTFSCTYHGYTR